jgi:hypothetical protein
MCPIAFLGQNQPTRDLPHLHHLQELVELQISKLEVSICLGELVLAEDGNSLGYV